MMVAPTTRLSIDPVAFPAEKRVLKASGTPSAMRITTFALGVHLDTCVMDSLRTYLSVFSVRLTGIAYLASVIGSCAWLAGS